MPSVSLRYAVFYDSKVQRSTCHCGVAAMTESCSLYWYPSIVVGKIGVVIGSGLETEHSINAHLQISSATLFLKKFRNAVALCQIS